MKVDLILAEAGTNHPDGTISLLRAGITNVWRETPPIPLTGVLAVRLETETGEGGNHSLEVTVRDEDGKSISPTLKAEFKAPDDMGRVNLLLGFQVAFPKFGKYEFMAAVDKIKYAHWLITASKKKKKE